MAHCIHAWIHTDTESDHVCNGCNPAVTDRDVELSTEWELNNSVLITAVHTSMNNPNTVRVPGGMERLHTGKQSSCNTHTEALDVEEEPVCFTPKTAPLFETGSEYKSVTCTLVTQKHVNNQIQQASKSWYACIACRGLGGWGILGEGCYCITSSSSVIICNPIQVQIHSPITPHTSIQIQLHPPQMKRNRVMVCVCTCRQWADCVCVFQCSRFSGCTLARQAGLSVGDPFLLSSSQDQDEYTHV